MKADPQTALGVSLLALGVIQVSEFYQHVAPSLQDVRAMEPGDDVGRQQLLDADIIVGTTVTVAAIAACLLTDSYIPFVALFGAFVVHSGWRHLILASERF